MTVLNDLDRFHLFGDAINRLPQMASHAANVNQFVRDRHVGHKQYIGKHGEDMPEIHNWKWSLSEPPVGA